jgi:hypothetical protein
MPRRKLTPTTLRLLASIPLEIDKIRYANHSKLAEVFHEKIRSYCPDSPAPAPLPCRPMPTGEYHVSGEHALRSLERTDNPRRRRRTASQ